MEPQGAKGSKGEKPSQQSYSIKQEDNTVVIARGGKDKRPKNQEPKNQEPKNNKQQNLF